MTGTLDLDDNGDGEVALIEENGEWSLYLRSDIEEKSDGSWGPVTGAEPSGTLNLKASNVRELLLTEYASAEDAPPGSGVGIVGVTSDGHLLLEDGQ